MTDFQETPEWKELSSAINELMAIPGVPRPFYDAGVPAKVSATPQYKAAYKRFVAAQVALEEAMR